MKDVSSEIENLKSDVRNEDNVDSFMEPGKKKRGRPKGSKTKVSSETVNPMGGTTPPVPDVEATKKLIAPAVSALSVLGVKLAEDEAAAMQPTETEIIIDSAAACVNQYLPGVLGAHANAVILSVALAQWSFRVYLLRQATLAKLKREKQVHAVPEQGVSQ